MKINVILECFLGMLSVESAQFLCNHLIPCCKRLFILIQLH